MWTPRRFEKKSRFKRDGRREDGLDQGDAI